MSGLKKSTEVQTLNRDVSSDIKKVDKIILFLTIIRKAEKLTAPPDLGGEGLTLPPGVRSHVISTLFAREAEAPVFVAVSRPWLRPSGDFGSDQKLSGSSTVGVALDVVAMGGGVDAMGGAEVMPRPVGGAEIGDSWIERAFFAASSLSLSFSLSKVSCNIRTSAAIFSSLAVTAISTSSVFFFSSAHSSWELFKSVSSRLASPCH